MNLAPILNKILICILVINSIIISSFSSENDGCTEDFSAFGHKFLTDCDDEFHNSKNYFIAITLNGKINIIDAIQGKIKWTREIQSNPLISSTIGNYMKIQNGNGELVQILPSLDGNLYVYEDGKIEKTEFSAEKLLKSSLKFNENILLVGGQESKIMGLNLNSGDLIYDCGHAGCSEENCSTFGDMVLLRKNSQSVRAINTMTGHEEWHFVVDDPQVIQVSNQECHSSDESPYSITFKVMLPTGQIKTLVHFTNDSMQSEIYNIWNLTLDSPIVNMWHLINTDLRKIDLFDPDINSFETFIPEHVEQSSYLYLGSFNNHLYIQTSSNENELIQYNDDKNYKNQQKQDFIPLEPEQANNTQLVVSDGRFSFLKKNNVNNNATGFLVFQYNNNVVASGQPEECSSTDIVAENPSETIYVYITEYVYISITYYWKEILCCCLIFSATINTLWCLVKPLVKNVIPNESLPCSSFDDSEKRNNVSKNDHQYDAPPPKQNKFGIYKSSLVLLAEPEDTPKFNSRFLEDFEPLSLLGKGGFGRVFEAKHKIDESHYAVKRIRIPAIEENRAKFTREIRALSQLDHVNIVRYYNAWVEEPPIGWQEKQDQLKNYDTTSTFNETSFVSKSQPKAMARVEIFASDDDDDDDDSLEIVFKESSDNNTQNEKSSKINSAIVEAKTSNIRLEVANIESEDFKLNTAHNQQKSFPPKPKAFIYIQMQLCQKETLKDWLLNNFERDNASIINMFVQILQAVNYVHSHNLIHRDLKPSNIFFSKDGLIKIGDFGLVTTDNCDDQQESTSVDNGKNSNHTNFVGTKLYMSPEQIKNQSYDHKVDIYSMGIILYELLIPFKTESERILELQNARKQRFSDILLRKHKKEKTIIEKLLAESPKDRPETDELLKYDLFCAN